MFWRFGAYANTSTIDNILDKPDVTLEELLDESDLIQELKQHNTKLIEYLRDENVLRRLLEYVVAPGEVDFEEGDTFDACQGATKESESSLASTVWTLTTKAKARDSQTEEAREREVKARLKYAYIACEVLSSDTWSISEALMENHQYLQRFWEFLKTKAPLDPLQAGYFTKVNETLLDKKTEEMLDFFKSVDNVVRDMLQHVDCPMVMDLLLKIISLEKAEGGQGIVDVSAPMSVLNYWTNIIAHVVYSPSGFTRKILFPSYFPTFPSSIPQRLRHLLATFSKRLSLFPRTRHRTNNLASVRTN